LAPVVVFGSRFASNIIMSRLLAPDEFGTAVAISVVLGLGGLATDVALDRFVMINGSPRALSTAHMLAALNGILLATILIVAAPSAAKLFGVGNFSGSFALAAGVSAIGAFANLSVKQIQRNYDYGPDTIAQVCANLAGLAALFLAATTIRDHRAIIASLGVQLSVYALLSHVLARDSYRLGFDRQTLRDALSFGLPLTLNGVGLAVMSQLDRVLVGYWFGVKILGVYAVILSMSVVPTSLMVNIFSGPSFSFLLAADQDRAARSERYHLLLGLYAILAGLYAIWLALALDVLIPLVFGAAFSISAPAHVLFILIACLRLQRSGAPTSLLLASGRTKQLALLNLSAGFGLVAGLACIMIWARLESMLVGLAIGELISFVVFFTSLGKDVTRGYAVAVDLIFAMAVPVVMVIALAWNPAPVLGVRLTLLLVGSLAVGFQIYLEFYRNAKLRNVLFAIFQRAQGRSSFHT
jgi:O-antigen/teichoic acid export membrane protein